MIPNDIVISDKEINYSNIPLKTVLCTGFVKQQSAMTSFTL